MRSRLAAALAAATIVAATSAVYRGVGAYPFVFDDVGFILQNPPVVRGLSVEGARWALTGVHGANWQPLTWLIYMANVSAFGLRAGAHHWVNVAGHALAGVLLLLALRRLTGALWPSAFVAALFAVHPLHVESVAWVSEVKDPVSAVFWFLACGAWARYAARPGPGRYAVVAALFALGLLTKPIVVTLPAVLLLLDWWPLGRLGPAGRGGRSLGALALEKVPLLALAAAASAIVVAAQHGVGAVASLQIYTPAARAVNALVSCAAYLGDTLWPSGLAVFYPHPLGGWKAAQLLGALALLSAVTAVGVALRRRCPALLAGWGWFLLTLAPVIGLVQAGGQARADRYMYLPLVGLGLAAATCAPRLVRGLRHGGPALALAALAALAALGGSAARQTAHWRSGEALWLRALAVTRDNWLAHMNYGVELFWQGRDAEALRHFEAAVRLNPAGADARFNLALALTKAGRDPEAIAHFRAALLHNPGHGEARYRLGLLLGTAGRLEEAREQIAAAARLLPRRPDVWTDLGVTYGNLRRYAEAEGAFREALRLDGAFLPAHAGLEKLRRLR